MKVSTTTVLYTAYPWHGQTPDDHKQYNIILLFQEVEDFYGLRVYLLTQGIE